LLPSNCFEELVDSAQKKIQETAGRVLGADARVKNFGSILQGTFLEGSDLDLYIIREQKPELVQTHAQQVSALRKLESTLPLHGFEVKDKRYEWHVRVPILILVYQDSSYELQVDISIGEADHEDVEKGQVDRLIQAALNQAPVALPLVLLVKRWAKIEGLNKAFEGNLSPLAWTLLCLFFLIHKGLLPRDALATPSRTPAPRREPQELCTNCPKREDLAEFFSMVCRLGRRTRQRDEGPYGVALLPARECHGEVNDKALFFVEDPAARCKNRMVNVARGVKDKAKWEHLLRRCEGASAVLRTRNFKTDIFFRKRVLVGLAPKSKAIQAKPMPRPNAEPVAKNAGIEKKARPTAVPLLLPTAKIAPKHPPPKAQPQPPKVPGLAVLKLRLPAPLKPGVSKPTPQGGPAPKTPPKNPSKLGPPKTPPKNGGYSGAWTEDKPSTPASRNAWQAKPQPSQDEEQSGSRWRAKSDDSHRWKKNEGASKRARSNDRSQRDTWKQGRWKQRDKQGQHEQRWQRTTWKV